MLQIDQGPNAETVKIATILSPPPAAPAANVTFTSALTKNHLNGVAVYVPQVVDGKILQSQSLTPLRTDPRLNDPTDTVSNGAGGSAPRRMTLDGAVIIPKTVPLNRLTVGKHVTTVAAQDTAGSTLKYTNTFVVTTSFADLATVIDMDADNALRTTLNGATAVGATGLRLATPFGFRAGQTIVVDSGANAETVTLSNVPSPPPTVSTTLTAPATAGATAVRIASYTQNGATGTQAPTSNGPIIGQPIVLDTGANQEVVSVKSHISPIPAAPAPNVVLSAPLTKDHASGAATTLANVILSAPLTKAHATGVTIANPQPIITDAKRTELKGLLADAKTKADASDTAGAIAALNSFKTAAAAEPALASSAQALIDQLQGKPVDTTGTGVAVGPADPGDQAIRQYWNPTVPAPVPGATYKVLVNGRAGGFRHQTIVDFEYMIQKMAPGERLRRRHLGPEHQRQPRPPGPGRRLAGDQPVPRPQHAQAVQDAGLRLDRRHQRHGDDQRRRVREPPAVHPRRRRHRVHPRRRRLDAERALDAGPDRFRASPTTAQTRAAS